MKTKMLITVLVVCLAWITSVQAGSIANGLVAHLTFDETYNDSSGNGVNGAPVGAPSFAPGKIGSHAVAVSTEADGSAFNYVTLGMPPVLELGADVNFTISFWVKINSWTDDPPFIGNKDWNSGSNQGWVMATGGDGRLQWNFKASDSGRLDYDGPAGTLGDNNWHNVIWTVDRQGQAVTYLDGAQVDARSVANSVGVIDTFGFGQAINIGQDGAGAYTDGGSAGIDALIDDVGIWKRVLTGLEAGRLYKAGLSNINLAEVPDPTTPYVGSVTPADGDTNASPVVIITIDIQDGTTQLDTNSVELVFDGVKVSPEIARVSATNTIVSFDPPGLLAATTDHTFELSFSDTSEPPVLKTAQYVFRVSNYRKITLPDPIYLETFDGVEEGQFPNGWTTLNYTDWATPGFDLNDPLSDIYLGWVVISRQRVLDIGAVGGWDAALRLQVLPNQIVNEIEITNLVVGNFVYAESDQRSGSQVQYLFSPDYDLSGKSDVYVSYHSIYEQNQDNIGAVEYSIDGGMSWLPIVYMIDEPDIVLDQGNIDAVATLTQQHDDAAVYVDPITFEAKGGTYGSFIGAPITQDLAPYISGRINDDPAESKRVELFRLTQADNQPMVRFRFAQAGTASWYFGIDNFGLYSITEIAPPTVGAPASQTAAVGNSATFTASPSGTGPFTYQWQFNGNDIPEATNASLAVANVQLHDAGEYVVVVSNAGGSAASPPATLTVFVSKTKVTGQWDFDQGDLRATVGNDLECFDETVTMMTTFGSTTFFGIPDVGGQPAQVIAVPELVPMNGYIMRHGAEANGGGSYVNQYTLIMDVLYPLWSDSRWRVFLQTNPDNSNDGDFFVNPAGGIGISGNYQGTILPDTWHRVAFAVDLAGPGPAPVVAKFIDGVKVSEQTLGSGKDGRWSLNTASDPAKPYALLFADNDGDNAFCYVSSIQFREGRLSDAAITALGGVQAGGIPLPPPELRIDSIVQDGGDVTISWSGGSGIRLQKSTSLSNPVWQDVQGTLGGNSYTEQATGNSAFYRLAK